MYSTGQANARPFGQFDKGARGLTISRPGADIRLAVQVSEFSLLLKWKASAGERRPALFISHQDVVDAGPESRWTHPPYGGIIEDGFVWGRGALDVKVTMTAMLEAIDHLLSEGYTPILSLFGITLRGWLKEFIIRPVGYQATGTHWTRLI